MSDPKFTIYDYLIIGSYLAGMVVLGIMFSGRQKTLKEYFHASGNLPWWAVGISLIATGLSPISYLAFPGWVFERDSRTSLVGGAISFCTVFASAAIWIPLWGRLRVMTVYEYLERRYHAGVRTFGAILFMITTTFWVGTALVTASKGFEEVTGFHGRWCLVIIAMLGTAYTVLGGMRAVIWTDVIQYCVFMVGYLVIGATLLTQFSPIEIWTIATAQISEHTGYPHTQLISFELSTAVEATIWVMLFSAVLGPLGFGSDQLAVQRLHSTSERRGMYKAMIVSGASSYIFVLMATPAAWGFVAYYHQHPEFADALSYPDKVMPHYVIRNLPLLLRSLVMGGVLAALMSTFDSALNSMSNVASNDFYRRYFLKDADESHYVMLAKILTTVFGLLLFGFAMLQYDQQLGTAGEHLTRLSSLISAPIVSFFALGVLSKRVNTPGILCGAVAAIAFSLSINGFPPLIQPIFRHIHMFDVHAPMSSDLDNKVFPDNLRMEFQAHEIGVSEIVYVKVLEPGKKWRLTNRHRHYQVEKVNGVMRVSTEPINWMWIGLMSMIVNLSIGYFASYLFPAPHADQLKNLTLRR